MCDRCPDGFQLDWFSGVCAACASRNCRTCNLDLTRCDSCYPGFTGDHATGHCLATNPVPLQGRCEGLVGPYTFVREGSCGKQLHWFGCDVVGDSALDCYNAVMAEDRCSKDYFTFNARSDQNCGCKISNEAPVVEYPGPFSDCYVINDIIVTTPAATTPAPTFSPTPAPTFSPTPAPTAGFIVDLIAQQPAEVDPELLDDLPDQDLLVDPPAQDAELINKVGQKDKVQLIDIDGDRTVVELRDGELRTKVYSAKDELKGVLTWHD